MALVGDLLASGHSFPKPPLSSTEVWGGEEGGEGTHRGAAGEMRVLKSLSVKRRRPWGHCLIFSLFLKVTHVTFYLCQLIEQRSPLITSGAWEEQAVMLRVKLTAQDVAEPRQWETRARSECEINAFLLPNPPGLVTRRAGTSLPAGLAWPTGAQSAAVRLWRQHRGAVLMPHVLGVALRHHWSLVPAPSFNEPLLVCFFFLYIFSFLYPAESKADPKDGGGQFQGSCCGGTSGFVVCCFWKKHCWSHL